MTSLLRRLSIRGQLFLLVLAIVLPGMAIVAGEMAREPCAVR